MNTSNRHALARLNNRFWRKATTSSNLRFIVMLHGNLLTLQFSKRNSKYVSHSIALISCFWRMNGTFQGNSYVFNMAPPISLPPNRTLNELKEWGSQVTQEEIFTLDALDEFQSSDLRPVFQKAEKPYTSISMSDMKVKQRTMETSSIEPEVKEKQLKTGSLFRVIPQVAFRCVLPFVS